MKKIIYTLAATALLFTGCTLDRDPETELGDTNFWMSETDFRGACNQLYVDLPGFGSDLRSDEQVSRSQNSISSGNRTVSSTSGDWTNPYTKIGRCNKIITKGEESTLTEGQKNRWIAEARFFRAYHYFDLVKKYGDVPLILKVFDSTDDPDIKKGRDPRETVIQQCYADLEFAKTWLPDIDETSAEGEWGRVTQSAALGMLVRIGLYEGTYIKYHQLSEGDYTAHLQKSIDAAEDLIGSGKHTLFDDFETLFYFEGEGRQNRENIFVKIYGPVDSPVIMHSNSHNMEGEFALTRQIIDYFLYTDGLPRGISPLQIPEVRYADILKNRDPRMEMTLFQPGEDAYKGIYKPFDTMSQNHGFGYPCKKGFMEDQMLTSGRETVDKMIIRYAEILLSYAEAKYELEGSVSDDLLDKTVNYVRSRAGFTAKLTNDFCTTHGLNMRDEIRRERIVELMVEGLHYDDIIRWKTAEEVLPKAMLGLLYSSDDTTYSLEELGNRFTDENGYYNGVKVYDAPNIYVIEEPDSRQFDPERDYLYPIPTYEIATSDGAVKQNPKW